MPDRTYDATHEVHEAGRRLASLTVSHMDGLRIDRLSLRLPTSEGVSG